MLVNPADLISSGLDGVMNRFDSPEARVMLYAIGLQESRFKHRRQVGGPARGFWQFERGGGVVGVLNHASSRVPAYAVSALRGLPNVNSQQAYAALEHDDMLACAFARLLLYTDPRPLPRIGDADGAWGYYIDNWRPGKPHRATWNALYAQAQGAF